MSIKYVTGDATAPQGDGPKFIVHICNDIGAWGSGFVLAVSKRWPAPEQHYRALAERLKGDETLVLGMAQAVQVEDSIYVVNLIGQRSVASKENPHPIRYWAVREGLLNITHAALGLGASVHMPRIGCGLAGGLWEEIEPIIEDTLVFEGVPVTVYDLPRQVGP